MRWKGGGVNDEETPKSFEALLPILAWSNKKIL